MSLKNVNYVVFHNEFAEPMIDNLSFDITYAAIGTVNNQVVL